MNEKQEYNDSQYWAVDNLYDIDDLLAEQEEHDFKDAVPGPWGGDKKDAAEDKDEEDKAE